MIPKSVPPKMTSGINLILYLLISYLIAVNEAGRILAVFPTPSISHQAVFRPLTQELARRGHEVVVITTDPVFPKGQTPANLTEIDVHEVSYRAWSDMFLETPFGKNTDLYQQAGAAFKWILRILELQMKSEEVRKIIEDKNRTFDLLLIEACVRTALGLSHLYKVPVIQISSFGRTFDGFEYFGAPTHPILYPVFTRQRLHNLSFWEKARELYNYYLFKIMANYAETIENGVLKRIFGPDVPSLSELINNVHMLFLNIHPLWEGNFPTPPGIIHMGGLHQKPENALPEDLKKYLDSSKKGVIYISYGTNITPSLLSKEKIQILINVFSQLPYDVLWKWDKDELPGIAKNIKLSKWLPQSDLLRHPKIKLFITQGGLQSTDEAITAGVPLIGMPMLVDQWYNVEKYLIHKIGLRQDIETLTEEEFKNAINTVIEDKSYRQNIVRLRNLMHDQPQDPLEKAVWWTEYVLRHGGAKHLRAPAANITWWEYLELDIVGTLLLGLILSTTLCIPVVIYLWRIISRKLFINTKSKTD